jgi:Flp pilus assembly protein TadG
MIRLRQVLAGRGGYAAIETAMVAPLLFLILLGFTDVGRAYYQYITLTNAAREGARYASVTWSAAGALGMEGTNSNLATASATSVQGKVQATGNIASLNILNDATHILVTYWDTEKTPPAQCAHWDFATNTVVREVGYDLQHPRGSDLVKVQVLYQFYPLTPMIKDLTGVVFNLSAESTMRVE